MKEVDVEFFLCINREGEYRVLGSSEGSSTTIKSLIEDKMSDFSTHRLKIKVPLPEIEVKHIDEVV